MKWLTIVLVFCTLVPCSFAHSRSLHHGHRWENGLFPAVHQSVATENAYANRMMLTRYQDKRSLERAVEAGELKPLDTSICSDKLPKYRRYALESTVNFIQQLDADFVSQAGHHLTVDSAVRSVRDQRSILRWNRSAAPATGPNASTHERGTTVDLSRNMTKGEYQWLRLRLFYYRNIGRVLVIEERRCLHIFVIGDHDEDAGVGNVSVWDDDGGSIVERDMHTVQGTSDPEVLQRDGCQRIFNLGPL